MDERADELAMAGAMHKQGGKRLKHLAEHPGLFPILIQVRLSCVGITHDVALHVRTLWPPHQPSQHVAISKTLLDPLPFR